MATFRFVIADVFTDVAFAGNQLAVFTDARDVPDELMQRIAKELNFSETVFVLPKEAGGHARIRIFMPERELPFAGHPVLGTAFVLGGPLQLDEIRLETGAGVVPVVLEREEARIVFGRMAQPYPSVAPYPGAGDLLAALGVERSELPVEVYDNGLEHVFVVLEGSGVMHAGDESFRLGPGSAATVEELELHWFENDTDANFVFVEFWAPPPAETVWADATDT